MEVRAASPALLELAGMLRSGRAVDPAGMAMISRLLGDDMSPVYQATYDDALRQATQDARRALDSN